MTPIKQKTYLVTGGCGFIGSHLVDKLLQDGHQVIVLDDLSTGKMANLSPEAELMVGDIRDATTVNRLMHRVDGCFHLAAVVSVELSNQNWVGTHTVNQTGTIQVFNAARHGKQGIPIPVVYASSAAVYGNNDHFPLNEYSQTSPLTAYGADKLGCELHAQVALQVFQVPTMGFRFFNVHGSRSDPGNCYSGVISIFVDKISRSEPITIFGHGEQTRDFVYVEDVVDFLNQGMQQLIHKKAISQVYNVCTGHETSIKQLSGYIGELLGKQVEIIYSTPRVGDIYRSVGCPLKAEAELKLKAKYSLVEGLSAYLSQNEHQFRM